MRILCFIDNLGSGGAQRQLATLAVGLEKRGHQVRFLVYHPQDHFLPLLEAAEIACDVIPPCSHGKRLLAVRGILRQGWQDVVLAFLEGPCFYAELARIPGQRWGLVAGERLADPRINRGSGRWRRHFHRLADAVVCNSHTNRLMLENAFPNLTGKLATIYNTVDFEVFHPSSAEYAVTETRATQPCRIVVAAAYHEKKNMMGVAKALLRMKQEPATSGIVIDWYGAVPPDPSAYRQAEHFIADNGLSHILRLHPPIRNIEQEYANASAAGLFSFFEGLPNVVCEAMSCGKPILLSNVCDAGNLVRHGVNGFLCDPGSPESMASALIGISALSDLERLRMGVESGGMAKILFDRNTVLERYERILEAAVRRQVPPPNCSWPPEVPESAARTVEQWTHATGRERKPGE